LHLGTAALLDFHARHRKAEALVLVTITSTRGSTYRKPGAMMLIAPDKTYEGLISGGCLEGDLLQHASSVFSKGGAMPVTYDMRSDDDLVWGLGIGCDGVIELLLQRLDGDVHRKLFDGISRSLSSRRRVLLALVTKSESPGLSVGSLATQDEAGERFGDERLLDRLGERLDATWPDGRFEHQVLDGASVMLINLVPQPRILLCGGGPDAVPMAAQVSSLGWQCLAADHRPAFARAERFPAATQVVHCRAEALAESLDLAAVDAAVVMSHHLESDAAYLRQLAPLVVTGSLTYLGVLGPVARRKRLQEMADCSEALVHGPVGLDIGAELPESIALAVIAEIHAVFNRRDGQSLTTGPVGDGV
jgi:xanthine dehydrogenase accessory factor